MPVTKHNKNKIEFAVETMEPRQMLAGDVSVITSGNDVTIIGDAAANHIQIGTFEGRLSVIDLADGTVIHRGETDVSNVNNLTIRLNQGDDRVELSNVEINGNFRLFSGAGDDQVELRELSVNGTSVAYMNGGANSFARIGGSSKGERVFCYAGSDNIHLDGVNVEGNVAIRGNHSNVFTVEGSSISGNVFLRSGREADQVNLVSTDIGGDLKINTGADSDRVHMYDAAGHPSRSNVSTDGPKMSIDGNLVVKTGSGRDGINFNNFQVAGRTTIEAGSGNDGLRFSNWEGSRNVRVIQGCNGFDRVIATDWLQDFVAGIEKQTYALSDPS